MKKEPKLRIKTANKCYSIHDAALYKVTSKRKLSKILLTNLVDLKPLTRDLNYNEFLEKRSKKSREIQQPNLALDKVHTRIASLLCRIMPPDYLHSGIKGRSHITNAKVHIGPHPVLTTDIQNFFQSTTRESVFKFFRNRLHCSSDVADLLATLCTFRGHIPTGSRISLPLAFWANEPMFSDLARLANNHEARMSVFVDDLTFSGENVNNYFKEKVKKVVSSHGHTIHPLKTKLYPVESVKVITGVGVVSQGLVVLNRHQKSIYQDVVSWLATRDGISSPSVNNRLLGKLNSQSLIDSRLGDKARSLRADMRE